MLKLALKIIKKKLLKSKISKLMYFTFFFIFNSINSFANDLPPSTIVDDLVNVTTGHLYLNKTDSIALGKEPFLFTRKYLNITNLDEVSDRDLIYPNELESEEFKLSGWSFLKYTKACIKSDKGGRRLDIYDSNGSALRFDFPKLDKKQKNSSRTLKLRNVFMGFSEIGNAITEANNNYRNVKIISENDKDITVYLANGVIRKYHRIEGGNNNYDLQEEILKNGNKIVYEHNNHGFITKISTISPKNKVLSFITMDHKHADWKRKNKHDEKTDKYDFSIKTNTAQTIHYMFDNYQILLNHKGKRYDEKLFYLKEIKTPTHTENIKYYLDYKQTNPLLSKYHLPDGRFFKVNYYLQGHKNSDVGISIKDLNDDKFQKVSSIESFDSINKPKYRFFYEFATPYKKGGKTTVLDYYDNKTIYHYSNKLRVQKIEKYQLNTLHNFEIYLWGKDDSNEEGFYKGSVLHNNKGRAIHALVNTYDNAKKGNIVKKVIYGNLTGNNDFVALDENGYPSENSNESYSKTFEYNDDNLIIKETDEDGVSIEYTYLSNTNLVSSKFVKYLDQIKQRFFYKYDEDNFLVEEIEDDGISKDKNDLSHVTKRLIKKTIPSKDLNLYGFTGSIEEKYLDLNTLKERLLKKENLFYFSNGKIKQKDIYDANNTLRYSLYYTYDSKGNLESGTDPLGRKATYKYDANSNKIYEKDFADKITFFEHDQNNRLIKKTLKVNGIDYSTKYQYDVNNNLTLEIDPRDNITEFKYDAFGNVIEKILPLVLDENKNLAPKVFKYEYDELGRCIKEISPTNDITIKKYNYYGNITYIKHQDNTEERFIYNKNGTLKKHINQIGTAFEYEYDYQKRVTSKKIISSKEEKLFEENFEYSAYDLLSHIDNAKNRTNYSYDYAGKKK